MTRWRTRLARGGVAGPLAVVAAGYAVLVLPHASGYAMRVLTLAGIYALLAVGYRFIFGLAGALSLAQGTFMGVGAYVSGVLATRWGVPFDLALPASIGLPVLLALLVAIPVLRLQTHYFALATLLIGQVALLVATQWQDVTGGSNGIGGVPPLSLLGASFAGRLPTLLVVWVTVAVAAGLAWQAGRGRLGDAYAVARAHPAVARSVGLDTGALRLTAFLLSAGYAGLAGSLYVHAIGVLSPDVLGFPVMVTCLTIAVVGSRLRVAGAVAGAVLIIELPEWARFLRDDYLLAFGCILLLVVVAVPGGLTEAADRLLARLWQAPPDAMPAAVPVSLARGPASALLEVSALGRRFGGVRALDGVSLTLQGGEVLGLIGPNGSGKTTLLNAVTGIFPPDAGSVRLAGQPIGGRPAHVIARLGVARTFQTAALVPHLSALDNVAVARDAAALGLWSALRGPGRAAARAAALGLLDRMGAAEDAATLAGALPPGTAADLTGDSLQDGRIDAVILIAEQGLPGQLDQDSAVTSRAGFAAHGSVFFLRLHLGHHFADEIVFGLLDACTHFVAYELHDLSIRFLDQFLDRRIRILDERLTGQSDLRQILAQPAFDHFRNDVRRLLLAFGLFSEHAALFLQHVGGHIVSIDISRIDGRHMHRKILGQRFIAALQRHHTADAAAVNVGTQCARRSHAHEPPDIDFLADLGHQSAAPVIQTGPAGGERQQCRKVRRRLFECRLRHVAGKGLELVAAGDEIGFAIDLDHGGGIACALDDHCAFGGNASRFLVGLRKAGFAHQFGGCVQVTLGFHERSFAFHHAGAGTLAQLLD